MSDVFRALGCSLAAVSIAALFVSGCSSDGSRANATVATAGTATKDLFLRGTVTRGGKGVAGAHLEVVVEDELANAEAKVGDALENFTAAKAVTDETGAYTLRLKADGLPSKYFSPAGRDFLNFSINVVAGKQFATWSSTMYPEGRPAVWRTSDDAATADAVMRADFDLGAKNLTTFDSFGQKESSALFVISASKDQR